MQPPLNTSIIDFPTAVMWFDDDGILCSVAKKATLQTIEEAKATMIQFKELIGEEKVCILSDSTDSPPANKELRDYAAEVFPEIVKAVAIISRSAASTMAANLFFSIKKQPYPVKMFTEETEAKAWLKQYL